MVARKSLIDVGVIWGVGLLGEWRAEREGGVVADDVEEETGESTGEVNAELPSSEVWAVGVEASVSGFIATWEGVVGACRIVDISHGHDDDG